MLDRLFFNIAPAISAIFKLGFEPKSEYFYELTDEQYIEVANSGEDIDEALYMILPKEYKHQTRDTIIVTESQKNDLLKAVEIIESYCNKSDKRFNNYDEKLIHVSKLLPPVFTKNSKFEREVLIKN